MRWSWKLGKLMGIDLYVHGTFFVLILWVVFLSRAKGHTIEAVLGGVGFILTVFACVVLHEFGHALVARHYGIATKDITLLPIGGVSRLDRIPEEPRQEFWVSLAGPAVNLVIGGIIYACLFAIFGWKPVSTLSAERGPFWERVFYVNIALFLFNLIPAFPMDGGRILRALLSTRMDHVRATQLAASVGQALALVLGLVGLLRSPFLVFIPLFVWIGAAHEASAVQIKDVFSGIPIRSAMQTNFAVMTTNSTLGDAVKATLDGAQHEFPVMWGESVMGILTRANLIAGLSRHGPEQSVSSVMTMEYTTAESNEMLGTALGRLSGSGVHTMPVVDDGKLVGLLTLENLEYLMIQNALHRRHTQPPALGNHEM